MDVYIYIYIYIYVYSLYIHMSCCLRLPPLSARFESEGCTTDPDKAGLPMTAGRPDLASLFFWSVRFPPQACIYTFSMYTYDADFDVDVDLDVDMYVDVCACACTCTCACACT